MKELKVRITLIDEMLGTSSSDPEIYKNYIASKAPEGVVVDVDAEVAAISGSEVNKGTTVFPRDEQGNPAIFSYLIKGFFKNACKAMRDADGSDSADLKAYKSKIDNLIFIEPRNMLTINMSEGGEVGICERPLRASTPQGERVALASSESVPAGSTIEFTVVVLKDEMMKYVIEWLNYGRFNGLGCWHNSGKGAFTWEDLGSKEDTAPKKTRKKAEPVEETAEAEVAPAPKKRGRPKKSE